MLYFIMQATSEGMQYHNDDKGHFGLDDCTFLNQLEEGSLPPKLFDHKAHLRMAWLYLSESDLPTAIVKACATILKFDQLHGTGNKFHVTLTVAATKVVHHFMQKSSATDFTGFMVEFPVLNSDFNSLLLQHYDQGMLLSPEAKTEFIAPDLLPFD